MHIAADRGVRLQYLDRILIRIAYVEHERLIEPIGKLDLLDKRFRLHVFRAFIDAIVVETAFTDRDDLWALSERLVCCCIEYFAARGKLLSALSELLGVVVRLGRMHRMQSYRGVHTIVQLRQSDSGPGSIKLSTHHIHPHACIKRSLDNRIAVLIVRNEVGVRMRVKIFHTYSLRGNKFSGFLLARIAAFIFSFVSGINGLRSRTIL